MLGAKHIHSKEEHWKITGTWSACTRFGVSRHTSGKLVSKRVVNKAEISRGAISSAVRDHCTAYICFHSNSQKYNNPLSPCRICDHDRKLALGCRSVSRTVLESVTRCPRWGRDHMPLQQRSETWVPILVLVLGTICWSPPGCSMRTIVDNNSKLIKSDAQTQVMCCYGCGSNGAPACPGGAHTYMPACQSSHTCEDKPMTGMQWVSWLFGCSGTFGSSSFILRRQ